MESNMKPTVCVSGYGAAIHTCGLDYLHVLTSSKAPLLGDEAYCRMNTATIDPIRADR